MLVVVDADGVPQASVVKLLGTPRKAAEVLEGATGLWTQTWKYPQLEVGMAGEKKGGPKTVAWIRTSRPSLKTARGMHAGSCMNADLTFG